MLFVKQHNELIRLVQDKLEKVLDLNKHFRVPVTYLLWINQASPEGTAATVSGFIAELKSSSISRNLERGKNIHHAIIQSGHESNTYVASAVITMYGKCGCMQEARAVFEKMQSRDTATWTALILGYAENGEGSLALHLFVRMRLEGSEPNARTFLAVLRACTRGGSVLKVGKLIHLLISREGCDSNLFVESTLVDMYAKCGCMKEAYSVFESMQYHDVVSWNTLIAGYADNGQGMLALDLFSKLRGEACTPDARTFLAVFKACTDLAENEMNKQVVTGKVLHLLATRSSCDSDIYVKCSLVNMYAKFGIMENAYRVFETLHFYDAVTWTALILGYAENGQGSVALGLFCRMRSEACAPDTGAFVAAFKACIDLAEKEEGYEQPVTLQVGKALHVLASKCGCYSHLYVQSTVLDFYAKCGTMADARCVFDKMRNRDVVAWNAVILGYADNGESRVALDLFSKMANESYTPNAITFVAAFKACAALALHEEEKTGCLEMGKELHLMASKSGYDSDIFVGNTLVGMYSKCGSMDNANKAFENLQDRDTVSWNALILGHAENGNAAMALDIFSKMRRETCVPDACTFSAVLKSCALLGALEQGKEIYTEICIYGLQNDVMLLTCLVDFYAKCASLGEAKQMFDVLANKDLISWNALICGYSRLGDAMAVFELFDSMQHNSIQADAVTFLSLLTACSHAGLVEKGKEFFDSMSKYGVLQDMEHYSCMVDMFGRANKLEDCMAMLRNVSPNPVTWTTVLGACQKWKNLGLGRLAFEVCVSLDDNNPAVYALMASLYGSKGMWKEQELLQRIVS